MDKQKIKSVPRLTTDNPVDNFQTALNFTDVSEDGWVWLRQPEMALTEYARQLVKGHGSSIDLAATIWSSPKSDRSPLRRPEAEH